MEGSGQTDITLNDIETMISILERFIRLSKRAERVVRQLAPRTSAYQGDFMKEFMHMALQQKMTGISGLSEEYEEEPLDEETKAVIEKIRAKKQAETTNK